VNRIDELPKDELIVVMCRSGARAAAMANLLETDYSFKDIAVLDGGILGWIEVVDQSLEAY
jgi:adenylyltransferase/sulfurtransferase